MVQRYVLFFLLPFIISSAFAKERITMPASRDIVFVENRGQVVDADGRVRSDILFTAEAQGVKIFCTRRGMSYVLTQLESAVTSPTAKRQDDVVLSDAEQPEKQLTTYRLDVEFDGTTMANVEALEPASEYFNYYYAHCPEGITDVQSYRRIVYHNIYPSIDLTLYIRNNKLKYDFIVHPGGNPNDIQFRYHGADSLIRLGDGSLRIVTPLGVIGEERPYTYQGQKEIRSRYRVQNNTVRFELGSYNPKQPLVIDPGVVWSTYYGGAGNDVIYDVATDENRNVLASGQTLSVNYPVQNALQSVISGSSDACILKLNSAGQRLWSTYYGGSLTDYASGIDVNNRGLIAIVGGTTSSDFPIANALQSTSGGAAEAFVLKLNANGQRVWATYFGGNGSDAGNGVGINDAGLVAILGSTSSNNLPTRDAYQAVYGGSTDIFIAKIYEDGQLFWSTYMGGSGEEAFTGANNNALSIDISGNIVVTGRTSSFNFPVQTAFQPQLAGFSDCIIAKFNPFGELLWSTYYGGSNNEEGWGVATDAMENVIICGSTYSLDFPIQNAYQGSSRGTSEGFIVKFNPWGQRMWATFVGGSNTDAAFAVAVDQSNNIYATGVTSSADFPIHEPWQYALVGFNDMFVVRFSEAGQFTWGTFFGGLGEETGYGLDIDLDERVVVGGRTSSNNMPVVNPLQGVNNGSVDGFIVKFGCDITEPQLTPTGFVEVCHGTSVTISVPDRYAWYRWSNGATTASITVTESGVYSVLVSNGAECTSASRHVTVNILPTPVPEIDGSFTLCAGSMLTLRTSKPFRSYRWVSTATAQMLSSTATLSVSAVGSYTVTVTDEKGCTGTSAVFQVVGMPLPVTQILVMTTGATLLCPGDSVVLQATGDFPRYRWSHGPTTASVVIRQAGMYTVTATDENGCTSLPVSQVIDVIPMPTDPLQGLSTACLNSETSYTVENRSGVEYQWTVTGGTILTDVTTAAIRVRWTTSGTGSVSVIRMFRGCSLTTGPMLIAIADSLQPTVIGSGTVCPGTTEMLGVDGVYTGYRWSDGTTSASLSVTSPGTYWVWVSDSGGCAGTSQPFTVASASLPDPSIVIDGLQELCAGDSTVVRVLQNFAAYLWTDGSTSSSLKVFTPGTYSVRVRTEEGCSSTASITIPAAPPLVLVVNGSSSVCRNSMADYTVDNIDDTFVARWSVSGGEIVSTPTSQIIRVQWESGSVGTVTVEVSRQGTACTGTTTLTVTIEETLHPVVTATSLMVCPGGEVLLKAPSGYESYEWTPGGATSATLHVTQAGVYHVHVRDAGGCEGDSEPVEVRDAPPLLVTITTPITSLCGSEPLTLRASAGFQTYLWSTGATTADITVTTEGEYSVSVSDNNGCSGSTSISITHREVVFGEDSALEWTNLLSGMSTSATIVWRNEGTESVRVESVSFATGVPEYSVIFSPTLPADIAPGESLTIMVQFQAQASGSYHDTAVIAISFPCSVEREISLLGTVVQKAVSVIARLPDTTAYPWMREYVLPIYLRLVSPEAVDAQSVEFEVSMDATVFFPKYLTRGVITSSTVDISTGERTISGRIENVTLGTQEKILTEIVGDVLLGERDNTVLSLRTLILADGTQGSTQNGLLTLEGICREGGSRFVRSKDGFGITIQPQPVQETLSALVEVVEVGECSLELYSVDGRSEVVQQWRHSSGSDGARIISYDISRKGSGVYWLVLRTPTQTSTVQFLIVK